MGIIEALILGLIQGLTEFLPVSSSGHLEIFKQVLGLEFSGSSGLSVDIVVHAGSALAIMIFFIREFFFKNNSETHAGKSGFTGLFSVSFIVAAIIATLPALIAYKLFKDQIEGAFEGDLTVVAISLAITGLFLFFIDFVSRKNSKTQITETSEILPFTKLKLKESLIPWLQALTIGIFQAFALIPGISRSGSTIGAGILMKINREQVVKFSFMLGFIAIAGAVVLKSGDLSTLTDEVSMLSILVLFLASLISSFFALQLILFVVRVQKLRYFGFYCLVVAIISIIHVFA